MILHVQSILHVKIKLYKFSVRVTFETVVFFFNFENIKFYQYFVNAKGQLISECLFENPTVTPLAMYWK